MVTVERIKIRVWGGKGKSRSSEEVEVVKVNGKTMWVRLPDGNIIKRKSGRDY
jgi:hypothetical protein